MHISLYIYQTHKVKISDHSLTHDIDDTFLLSFLGNLEERARPRGSRMGTSSGGARIASAYSLDGSGEHIGANINDMPRRRGSMDETGRQRYYDSYWNRSYSINQRAWNTEGEHQQRRLQAGYGFFVVFASVAIFCKCSSA